MYSIILPHLKQHRKISSDISPLLYVLYQPIISMEIDDDIEDDGTINGWFVIKEKSYKD